MELQDFTEFIKKGFISEAFFDSKSTPIIRERELFCIRSIIYCKAQIETEYKKLSSTTSSPTTLLPLRNHSSTPRRFSLTRTVIREFAY